MTNTPGALETDFPAADDLFLQALGLVDASVEQSFDNHTTLVSRVLKTPVALVSIVQCNLDRQYFKSHVGLSGQVAEARQTPLSHSFCQHVRNSDAVLEVGDARTHAVLQHNGAVKDLGIIAYLGAPIHLPDGTPIGALCAIDHKPRNWTADDQKSLQQIALCVNEQIALKAALIDANSAQEDAQSAARSREEFLAHMAHEIRTPLNGIIGSVDLLTSEIDGTDCSRDVKQLLNAVDSSTQGLLRTLNDSLDLSKIDAGELALEMAPFNLRAAVADVIALHRSSAECKGVILECTATDTAPNDLRLGDEYRLRQVLGNLLSNAVKFTDHGTIHLHLDADSSGCRATVTDTGAGMSEQQLAQVFAPYKQADDSVARRKGGTGLGLAIVKKLITLMGGEVSVTSTPDKGTTFSAWAPFAPTDLRPDDAGLHGHMDKSFAGARVLVADDSQVNQMVLARMLESLGAEVVTVSDGKSALNTAQNGTFDMLFIDIRMPEMNGDDVARALRELERQQQLTKLPELIAVTANVFQYHVDSYLEAGFDKCLPKPIRRTDLLALRAS
ncbi:hypothetical protein NBRC116594_37560 [Shimia sp. NS0008-38b]|uniref:GAF domain-containing hybrid sensor histidine kinase/response regulator n=1 Tax=Shimia sp. NS0008-38b TaxID=3127653 RepID=UPI003108205B